MRPDCLYSLLSTVLVILYPCLAPPCGASEAGRDAHRCAPDACAPGSRLNESDSRRSTIIGGNNEANIGLYSSAAHDIKRSIPANCSKDVHLDINYALSSSGVLELPAGCFLVSSSVVIPANAVLKGAGRNLTTIKLADGADVDVVMTFDAYSLFGTSREDGVNGWSISDLTIDGNSQNQGTMADVDRTNGVALYGAGWRLKNVCIRNVRGHGIRSEWGPFGEPVGGLEANIDDVTIDGTGRHGWWDAGPHDLVARKLVIIDPSREADNSYSGLYTEGHASGNFSSFHMWHRGSARNRARFSVSSGGGLKFIASDFEGGRAWFEHRGADDTVAASSFYAPYGYRRMAGVILAGSRNIHLGNRYIGRVSGDGMWAIQLGTTSSRAINNVVSGGVFVDNALGPFNFVNDGGLNSLEGIGFKNGPNPLAGTSRAAASDRVIFRDESGKSDGDGMR